MPSPDDERLALLLRMIRRESGRTQQDVASAAGVPVRDVRAIKAGRSGDVRVNRVRKVFLSAGGFVRVSASWNGAAADRLLDARHAEIVESAVTLFGRRGWQTMPEVSFSDYGERGSIDLFAAYEPTRTVAVCEVKSDFGSLEETNRRLDIKVRLSPKIATRVFGWTPRHVARLLIVPNESTIRRVVDRHAATMNAIYPQRGREFRVWLRDPSRPLSAIWFVSNRPNTTVGLR